MRIISQDKMTDISYEEMHLHIGNVEIDNPDFEYISVEFETPDTIYSHTEIVAFNGMGEITIAQYSTPVKA